MTTDINNSLSNLALSAMPQTSSTNGASGSSGGSWFEAVAQAWGQTLDAEATKITTMSDSIGNGQEQPSQIAALSAESLRLSFMAQSEQTSVGAIGQSLDTMARKQ